MDMNLDMAACAGTDDSLCRFCVRLDTTDAVKRRVEPVEIGGECSNFLRPRATITPKTHLTGEHVVD